MKQFQLISLVILFAALAGCSSTSPEEKLAKQQQQNKIFAARVSESQAVMDKLTARINQTKADNIKYFAPKKLEDAVDEYRDAKKDYDEIIADKTEATKSQVADIKEAAFKANAALDAAYVIKKNAETILVESFDIRSVLKSLKAPSLKQYARSYKRLSDDIDDIVEDIADGDLEDARTDNGKLLPKLRALEVDVVQYVELSGVRARVASLKKQRASRYVPIAYKKSLSALGTAESTIAANVRDKEKITEVVAKTSFEIDRTSNILQAVQELASVKSNDREIYITKYENQLFKIAKAVAGKDLRNMTLAQQANEIVQLANSRNSALDTIKSSVEEAAAETETQLASLKAQVESKESLLQSQAAENSKLKALTTELEVKSQESDKRILELEKELLELKNKALVEATAEVAEEVTTEPAPESSEPVASDETKEDDASEETPPL